MSIDTIEKGRPSSVRRRFGSSLRARPLGWAGLALVVTEAAIAATGGRFPLLTAIALLVGPGFALLPLLPSRTRASLVTCVAAAPVLGFAATSVALITLASVDVRLGPVIVRLALAGLALVGLVALRGSEPVLGRRREGWEWLGLAAAVGLGGILQQRVLGGSPVPGLDWAKYALYADEVSRHGTLLIHNPYWMLGMPFREDPAVPALYGSYLSLAGQPAAVLAHGIWVFAVLGILSTFAFVRSLWGPLAGVIAASLLAVVPIGQDILAWHGLPNVAALALLPLILLYVATIASAEANLPQAVGLGLLMLALAASHRLSFGVGLLVVLLAVGAALGLDPGRRRKIATRTGQAAAAGLLLGPGVIYDLAVRNESFGGMLDYTSYLNTKVDLDRAVHALTIPFVVAGLIAAVFAARWAARDRRLVPLLCVLAVVVAFAYGWLLHVPLVYVRMTYFLPLALAPLIAIAVTRLLPARAAALVGAGLAAGIAVLAWGQAARARDFYGYLNGASLRGLDAVSARLDPGEVVVTDRCWSFLATWLLHTRTMAALLPVDIQPKAELARAREARAMLAGTAAGRRLASRLGVRFLIVDPNCTDATGKPARPPVRGEPFFVSKRLVVLELPQ